jgi:glycosyltransferase involved in cell wall biosynthesis
VLRWRVGAPLAAAAYRALVRVGGRWPLRLRPPRRPAATAPRLAYYTHAFPVLSETFIQREVSALRRAGVAVDVLSHEAAGAAHFDADAQALAATTIYLPWWGPRAPPPGWGRWVVRHPLRSASVLAFCLVRHHTPRKQRRSDRRLFNRALLLAGEIERRGITHVHAPWATLDATVALLGAYLAGAHYSVQARASDIHRRATAAGLRDRLHYADFIVTNTEYNAAVLRRLVPQRAAALHIVRNGIDLRRVPDVRRAAPCATPLRILSIGRLTEPKGFLHLLRACALLRDAGLAFHCEIVGGRVDQEVNYYLALKKLHRALDLAGHVEFAGAQPSDRVQARYADADVFVLPAVLAADGRREITPNVLIEAMAMQCAVISTPIGGIPEIVEDGVSGVLVPPGDAAALAQAMRMLADDPARRLALGRAARQRVEARFDIERNVRGFVALFSSSLS